MSPKAKALLDLVELLYEGLVSPEAWNDFLGALSHRIGCDCAAITFHDDGNRNPSMASSIGLSRQVTSEWKTYFSNRNPRVPQVLRALSRSGSWISASSLAKAPAIYRDTEYVTWLHRHDLHHSLLAAVGHEREAASVSLVRPRTSRPFGPGAVEFVHETLPHLQRVLRIHSRNETLSSLFEAGKMALDQLDTGVVFVDANGSVVLMNERAEAISDSKRLERLVSAALLKGSGRGVSGGAITIPAMEAADGLHVIVTPFRSNRALGGMQPAAVAYLCNPAGKPASRAATLQTLFGLTPAECRLTGLLHEGMDLRVAAERMSVTIATARFMLKRIFHKTGSHRQSQLIRLLSSLPGQHKARLG